MRKFRSLNWDAESSAHSSQATADREFCAPARYKGSTMSQNALSLDPNLTVLERPPCPKCHGPMRLSDVTSGSAGDTRTFECVMCNLTEKVTVGTKR